MQQARFFLCLLLALSLHTVFAQEGVRLRRRNQRGPLFLGIAGGLAGGVVGSWLKSRSLKGKYGKEKKDLLNYIQMQEDVYKQRDAQWTAEYQKLYTAYEKLETETLERDYEEFKAPDTDGDDQISRAEFAVYVRKYLSSFPELTEKDFPKFEEFDLNSDGIVSFEEWQRYLQIQKAKEQSEKAAGKGANTGLLDALYSTSSKSESFSALDRNVAASRQRGGAGAGAGAGGGAGAGAGGNRRR